jgi:hypothetical protein
MKTGKISYLRDCCHGSKERNSPQCLERFYYYGVSPKEVTWKRVLGKGEVPIADFNNVVVDNPQI